MTFKDIHIPSYMLIGTTEVRIAEVWRAIDLVKEMMFTVDDGIKKQHQEILTQETLKDQQDSFRQIGVLVTRRSYLKQEHDQLLDQIVELKQEQQAQLNEIEGKSYERHQQ